jgi:hypothetical protein
MSKERAEDGQAGLFVAVLGGRDFARLAGSESNQGGGIIKPAL